MRGYGREAIDSLTAEENRRIRDEGSEEIGIANPQRGDISRSLERLKKQISVLDETLRELINRISPVLQEQTTIKAEHITADKMVDVDVRSGMAQELDALNSRAQDLGMTLRATIDRVDL